MSEWKFVFDRDQRGNPAEAIFVELCRSRGIHAYLNSAAEQDRAARAAYDCVVSDIPVDVKADWMSWHSGNLCIEKASLDHSSSIYFAYAIPTSNGLTFHIFTIPELRALYDNYPKKIVGDQHDNYAVLVRKSITQSVGVPFWEWSKQLTK